MVNGENGHEHGTRNRCAEKCRYFLGVEELCQPKGSCGQRNVLMDRGENDSGQQRSTMEMKMTKEHIPKGKREIAEHDTHQW